MVLKQTIDYCGRCSQIVAGFACFLFDGFGKSADLKIEIAPTTLKHRVLL